MFDSTTSGVLSLDVESSDADLSVILQCHSFFLLFVEVHRFKASTIFYLDVLFSMTEMLTRRSQEQDCLFYSVLVIKYHCSIVLFSIHYIMLRY